MGRFQEILPDVLRHEGGYVDDKRDPGGATMQGVTLDTFRRFYGRDRTKEDLRNISRKQLAHIYQTGYWYPSCADKMWKGLDRVAFDAAVNSGPKRGIQWVQRGLGVTADGAWGPRTRAAITNSKDRVRIVQRACAARLGFMQRATARKPDGTRYRLWDTFGRGWSRRVAEVEAKATREAGMSPSQRRTEAEKARQVGKGQETGAAGAGGGSGALWGVDLPWETLLVVSVLLIFAAFVLWQKGRHNRNRAEAYAALNEEPT